jgi:lysophospholipase L1-like esterase
MTPIPSFFSLWICNNDILGYALSGGDGSDPITDTTTFTNAYSFMIATLLGAGAKGVVINIPSVTDIPYFTTVPYNAIPLDSVGAATANTAFAVYNSGLSAAVSGSLITQLEADERTINFVAGQNAVVIVDEGLTDLTGLMLPSYRQATAADLILLPLSSTLGTLRDSGDPTSAIGIGSPLLDGEVLTMSEVDEIETARTAFNTVISNLASASDNLAFYDAAALLADLNDGNGISYGTGSVDSTFGTGGAFSLDGVHPTARGYAIVANGIIESLSATFNAELPKTDPGTYSEIFFEYPAGYDFD